MSVLMPYFNGTVVAFILSGFAAGTLIKPQVVDKAN
jgi:hypothetical protein